jgi:hypothetical protein
MPETRGSICITKGKNIYVSCKKKAKGHEMEIPCLCKYNCRIKPYGKGISSFNSFWDNIPLAEKLSVYFKHCSAQNKNWTVMVMWLQVVREKKIMSHG